MIWLERIVLKKQLSETLKWVEKTLKKEKKNTMQNILRYSAWCAYRTKQEEWKNQLVWLIRSEAAFRRSALFAR